MKHARLLTLAQASLMALVRRTANHDNYADLVGSVNRTGGWEDQRRLIYCYLACRPEQREA